MGCNLMAAQCTNIQVERIALVLEPLMPGISNFRRKVQVCIAQLPEESRPITTFTPLVVRTRDGCDRDFETRDYRAHTLPPRCQALTG